MHSYVVGGEREENTRRDNARCHDNTTNDSAHDMLDWPVILFAVS